MYFLNETALYWNLFHWNGCHPLGHDVGGNIFSSNFQSELLFYFNRNRELRKKKNVIVVLQIFPIHMKGIGGSFVTIMNWFGSWAVSYSFNFLMSWSSYGELLLLAFSRAIFILKLEKEKKATYTDKNSSKT
jgi:hypothetical protein